MRRISTGARLTAWYAGLLAAALAIFGLLAVWQLRRAVMASADANLTQAVMGLETTIGDSVAQGDSEIREEIGEYAVALKPAISLDVRMNGLPVAVARIPGGESRAIAQSFEIAGRRFDVRAGISIAAGLAMVRGFCRALAAIAPVLLLFACAAGYWISRRALKPVDAITSEARSIGLENLSRRIALRTGGDELTRLSEAWNEMLGRLEDSVGRLSRFTADASHEMRSPVAVIRGTAELALRRDRPVEEYQSALREIVRQANRLATLIEDLLALARAEEGADTSFTLVDLAEAARAACGLVDTAAQNKGIHVSLEAAPEASSVRGHEPSIRRLVTILLDNAIKFSPEGGRVSVRVEPGVNAVSLLVEDHGPGIAPEDLPHIFERFYRADQVRTPGAAGAGLGLALAQSIAQSHRAVIRAETQAGRGALFRVTFPCANGSTRSVFCPPPAS